MRRLLIIEDDPRIAHNVSRSLTSEGYQTQVAYDGNIGQKMALEEAYDLVILDVNLPGKHGFEVCRAVRVEKPNLPIIMLTALSEIPDKIAGLDLGADDYIVKPFDLLELTARVAACLRRSALTPGVVQDEVMHLADLIVNRTTKSVTRHATSIDLTAKEFALLDYLIQKKGRIISKMELTEHVWHFTFDPGTNVVEVYINYLRKKIDREFSPKLIHTRPGLGYVLKEEAV